MWWITHNILSICCYNYLFSKFYWTKMQAAVNENYKGFLLSSFKKKNFLRNLFWTWTRLCIPFPLALASCSSLQKIVYVRIRDYIDCCYSFKVFPDEYAELVLCPYLTKPTSCDPCISFAIIPHLLFYIYQFWYGSLFAWKGKGLRGTHWWHLKMWL